MEQYAANLPCASSDEQTTLNGAHVAEIVTQWTGIPTTELLSEESKKLLSLEHELGKRVIGQEAAIKTLSEAIRRSRTGLKDPTRPIGSFLFLGSSGVGKTELSLALAEALFGTQDALIRLDMSEYMEKHSVSRMIGSPPGYVGFEEGGQLTEKIRRRPYAVVLFDEIEKAHPDVCNLLLQILEDGSLTDSQGRRVDFRNTVLILTSNVGSAGAGKSRLPGFSAENEWQSKQKMEEERRQAQLKETFRPEFLNRMDAILTFAPLERTQLEQIAVRMLEECRGRMESLGIKLEFDASVSKQLANVTYDPTMGARPLRREVTQSIENLLANEILQGNVKAGDRVMLFYDHSEDRFICIKKSELLHSSKQEKSGKD